MGLPFVGGGWGTLGTRQHSIFHLWKTFWVVPNYCTLLPSTSWKCFCSYCLISSSLHLPLTFSQLAFMAAIPLSVFYTSKAIFFLSWSFFDHYTEFTSTQNSLEPGASWYCNLDLICSLSLVVCQLIFKHCEQYYVLFSHSWSLWWYYSFRNLKVFFYKFQLFL